MSSSSSPPPPPSPSSPSSPSPSPSSSDAAAAAASSSAAAAAASSAASAAASASSSSSAAAAAAASPSASSSSTTQRILTLKISNGEVFTIEAAAAAASFATLKNMTEDCSIDAVIPVPNVDGEILAMVLKWCKKHSEESDKKELKKWDADFVSDLDQAVLYKLLMSADYLGGMELIDLLAQKVADMIKGKKAEQIRQTFNIQNDFTPEEEEAIRKKNAWAFY